MRSYPIFKKKIETLKFKIDELCARQGRSKSSWTKILPVTKSQPVQALEWAFTAGLTHIGENRVQEAVQKKLIAPEGLHWELIGHLQTNKIAMALEVFQRIQSVDSQKLLVKLNEAVKQLSERNQANLKDKKETASKIQNYPFLLQVNTGNDPAKYGCTLSEAPYLLEIALTHCPFLRIEGLMTIAPLTEDVILLNNTFSRLRVLRDELEKQFHIPLPELSMGMSSDWQIAVEQGSTLIRIGSYLFGN